MTAVRLDHLAPRLLAEIAASHCARCKRTCGVPLVRPLRSNSGAKPSRAHPPSPIFSLSGARPEVKAGPSPARSDPRQPQPSLTLWYRRRRLVGLRWGTGSRRARSCGPSFPEGKLLISAEPVEVEIERTEELISHQQALNNLKLHRLGVIETLGVPVHVAIIGKLVVNF